MLPARAFLVKMILLQKVILLFKLKNPVATMTEVVILVIGDACKRLFFTPSCWKKRSRDKTPPWTISGTLSFMELVGLNMTMRAIVGLTKTMLVLVSLALRTMASSSMTVRSMEILTNITWNMAT